MSAIPADFAPGPHRTAWSSSRDVAARRDRGAPTVVLVPTGAVEQHGPHLPAGVDCWLAEAVAVAVARSEPDVTCAEPVPYGCSMHHTGFAGTVTLTPGTYIAVIREVCESLARDGAIPLVVNGHGGNRGPLQVAVAELASSGVAAYAVTYFELLTDHVEGVLPDPSRSPGHAGALETSLVLHLWPDAVRHDLIPEGGTPASWPDPHLFSRSPVVASRPFEEINPTGVVGRPEVASAAVGERLFTIAVSEVAAVARRVRHEGDPAAEGRVGH